MSRSKLALYLGFVVLLLLAEMHSGHAAIINNNDPVGANYTIQAIDAGVTVDFTPHVAAPANNNTIGKLTLTPNHAALNWLGFTLKENAAAGATSVASGGLRVLLDVVDQNGMVVPWIDYHIRAVDTSAPVEPGNEAFHLAVAHFHDTTAGFGSNPLVLMGVGDNVIQLDYGLGAPVAPGATFTATNILLHERDYEGLQREFRIETIPSVPEPASFVLAAIGLIGLVAWRRRKR
jgi:hypothetical protein